jgi:hypothetical protein
MDPSSSSDKKKLYILIGVVMTVVVVILLIVLTVMKPAKTGSTSQNTNPAGTEITPFAGSENGTPTTSSPVDGAIMKVGDEYIYETDFNYELTYYPSEDPGSAEEILKNKMIQDSIILQGAQADGQISLDSTIYNSREKDYPKRIEAVMQLKDKLDQKATALEGSVISIWFNNMGAGTTGYEKGKKTALTEITRLQKDIKDKKISMEQAGFQIKNNASLAAVDSSYRANAIFNFSVSDNQKITYSPDIDRQIYLLNQGDTSSVLTGKDLDPATNQMIDSVYMVAQISKRATTTVTSYDKWLEEKTKAYAVEKY